MREFLVAILCICFTITIAANEADENKFTGSLLWKVSGNGLDKPSYILGTHHFVNISFLDQIKGFGEAFHSSEVIVGELDMANKAELIQKVQAHTMIAPGEKGYKDLLSEEEYQTLSANLITHLGIPLEPLESLKPTLISTLLAAKLFANTNPDFNPQTHVSIDEHLQVLATEKGKQVIGLEEVEDQIAALFLDPMEEQLRNLQCELKEISTGEDSSIKLLKLYKAADLNGLYTLAFDDDNLGSLCPMTKEKKHSILDNRNNKWLEKLPQLLKEHATFIVVGSLHLAGEEGLLHQLHKLGYEVEKVE